MTEASTHTQKLMRTRTRIARAHTQTTAHAWDTKEEMRSKTAQSNQERAEIEGRTKATAPPYMPQNAASQPTNTKKYRRIAAKTRQKSRVRQVLINNTVIQPTQKIKPFKSS